MSKTINITPQVCYVCISFSQIKNHYAVTPNDLTNALIYNLHSFIFNTKFHVIATIILSQCSSESAK